MYAVGAIHARYNEVTLFGKLRRNAAGARSCRSSSSRSSRGDRSRSARSGRSTCTTGRKYRLEVDGELSFRVARGLELNADGSVSRIRDQLSMPRRDATPEEVLLRLRELHSGYEVSFSIGVTYSFGSIFNNIVNPRFGTLTADHGVRCTAQVPRATILRAALPRLKQSRAS